MILRPFVPRIWWYIKTTYVLTPYLPHNNLTSYGEIRFLSIPGIQVVTAIGICQQSSDHELSLQTSAWQTRLGGYECAREWRQNLDKLKQTKWNAGSFEAFFSNA